MENKFDSKILCKKLERLDRSRCEIFGAACCERLLPNYVAFSRDANWGSIEPLRTSLDYVWKKIGENRPDAKKINSLMVSCEEQIPDGEDFGSLYTSLAQDAIFAVYYLLEYLLKEDPHSIVKITTYATDSVDLYVQEIESMSSTDPDLEHKILNHRFMQREIAQQRKDLDVIQNRSKSIEDLLLYAKSSWSNGGKSNLDLP